MLLSFLNILLFSFITYWLPKSENMTINYLVNALFYTSMQLFNLLAILPFFIDNIEKVVNSFT
jgi:hypothetical protein